MTDTKHFNNVQQIFDTSIANFVDISSSFQYLYIVELDNLSYQLVLSHHCYVALVKK